MPAITGQLITLDAISARQRRIVERHFDLVQTGVARCGGWRCAARHNLEFPDLVQEGCVALVEAVRAHDPARHGAFAPYAIARIHFAVSRYAHEHRGLVRVPFVTQRRDRKRRRRDFDDAATPDERSRRRSRPHDAGRGVPADRHRPDLAPGVYCTDGIDMSPSRSSLSVRGSIRPAELASNLPTIAELAGPRIDRILQNVCNKLLRASGRSPLRATIIRRCFAERWTIPEIDARTPIRQLARELGSSLGGITHCEARFEREAAAALSTDPVLVELRRIARRSPMGFAHRLSAEEWGGVQQIE